MHILITNDDGVQAPGLLALVQALKPLGGLSILAPDRNWSASGHVKTLDRPLRVRDVTLADGTPALSCDGAPSDCVALALLGIVKSPINLVVSGVNPTVNVGNDLTYSGTVTAAMEAAIGGVPGIAVSVGGEDHVLTLEDYHPAAEVARQVAAQVLQRSLPANTLLNVNVPFRPGIPLDGYAVTRQGLRIYRDKLVRRQDPRHRPYYWIGGEAPIGVPEDGTDIGALAQGKVSITPIHMDMTVYPFLDELRTWTWVSNE